MVEVVNFPLVPLQTNCFLAIKDKRGIVVDPGGDPTTLLNYTEKNGIKVELVVNTHIHFDHILGNRAMQRALGVSILASPQDDPLYQAQVEGGAGSSMGLPEVEAFDYEPLYPGKRDWLGEECEVMATPGHSPGGISIYFPESGKLLSGDLIFAGSIGRTDLPGGSMEQLLASVKEKVFPLPDSTVIYPGHGPETTVGEEKRTNPFFQSGTFF